MEAQKIGLVLSGGGYRGAAHAGALMAFEEFGIVPDHISGTSAGALAGALYAADLSPGEILEVFRKVKLFGIKRYARNKPGWVDTDTFKEFLLDYFPGNNFSALSKKLFVATTDLLNGKLKIFDSGELIEAVLASASFPGIFSPVTIGRGLYADGGILDNFPLHPVMNCNKIYGVYVSPLGRMEADELRHSYDVVRRAIQLRMHRESKAKFAKCDLVISPRALIKFNLFNPNAIDKLFEIGYVNTLARLREKYSERYILDR